MKDVREYLHLYLNCSCQYQLHNDDGPWMNGKVTPVLIIPNHVHSVRPILSRLSDMTEENAMELCKLQTPEKRRNDIDVHDISHCDIHFTDGSKWYGDGVEELNDLHVHFDMLNSNQFVYLLSHGYWLFGDEAFDKGLIIDKKTLQV